MTPDIQNLVLAALREVSKSQPRSGDTAKDQPQERRAENGGYGQADPA
jgi:hypothetical protein